VQGSLLLVAWQYRGAAPELSNPRVALWWTSAVVVSLAAVTATAVLLGRSVGELLPAQPRTSGVHVVGAHEHEPPST